MKIPGVDASSTDAAVGTSVFAQLWLTEADAAGSEWTQLWRSDVERSQNGG